MVTASLSLRSAGSGKRPPSPPGHWLLGHLNDLKQDPIGMLVRARSAYGDIVRFKLWSLDAVLLSHPDYIHDVLQKKHGIYDKNLEPFKRLSTILGQGMLTADGPSWEHQRDVAKPAFNQREVETFGPAIAASTADLVERWDGIAEEGGIVDMHKSMMHLTLRIAGRALFSVDLEDEAAAASDLLNEMLAAGQERVRSLIAPPMILPTRNNRCLKRSRLALEGMIDRIIDKWREQNRGAPDLLGRLLRDHDAIDPERRTRQFYDEAITLILAGHETTANALCFSLYLLGRHRDAMAAVRDEARSVLTGRPADVTDLSKLTFTRMVLDEAMRLYPPAWVIDRNAAEDDEIDGHAITRGSLIFLSPYVMHRHPAYWSDAERFDPHRFEKERVAERPRHVYFPFSLGPRVCIGASFALAEAVLVLATLIERFEVAPVEGSHLETRSGCHAATEGRPSDDPSKSGRLRGPKKRHLTFETVPGTIPAAAQRQCPNERYAATAAGFPRNAENLSDEVVPPKACPCRVYAVPARSPGPTTRQYRYRLSGRAGSGWFGMPMKCSKHPPH